MSSTSNDRVAVLGAGSWGTALAAHLGAGGRDVMLWGRDATLVEQMRVRRVNPAYLPDLGFPSTLHPTAAIEKAVEHARYVVVAIPSHGLRSAVRTMAPFIGSDTIVVSATKGLEVESHCRMSEVIAEETRGRNQVVVLSGPSFASEVARGLPTALVVASTDASALAAVQQEFRSKTFRMYASDDVVGVEIGAALKNVIAIAVGVVESLALGHNARSAVITRGLAEISRLAFAMGGRRETLAGLSGLGDLVLTCTGDLSRNRRVGIELGRGRSLAEIVAGMRMVAEGIKTTRAALDLAAAHGIELPIVAQMEEVIAGRCTPREAAERLMLRPQRDEMDGGE